jgi:hypothetical protein
LDGGSTRSVGLGRVRRRLRGGNRRRGFGRLEPFRLLLPRLRLRSLLGLLLVLLLHLELFQRASSLPTPRADRRERQDDQHRSRPKVGKRGLQGRGTDSFCLSLSLSLYFSSKALALAAMSSRGFWMRDPSPAAEASDEGFEAEEWKRTC